MASRLPWRLSILSEDTTATLAAGLAALIIARNQFALTVRPGMSYIIRERAGIFLPKGKITTWLFNAGPGIAIVYSVSYAFCVRNESTDTSNDWMSHDQVISALRNLGLAAGKDFALNWVGEGLRLSSSRLDEDGVEVLSFRDEFSEILSLFDIRVQVLDMVGDLHEQIIGCIYHSKSFLD